MEERLMRMKMKLKTILLNFSLLCGDEKMKKRQ